MQLRGDGFAATDCRSTDLRRRHPGSVYGRQQGAVMVLFIGAFLVIVGFFGLALDLSRVFNRKAEMQNVADSIAVSAARRLNGTSMGITDAINAARNVVEGGVSWMKPKYQYTQTMVFADAALQFGRSPDGSTGWMDAATAMASPVGVTYVRVDTSALDATYGTVELLFMPVLSSSLGSVNVSHTAVAGRRAISVTPLAICAMSPLSADKRQNPSGYDELVEFGFRRGVSYNLMNLNSKDTNPANYLVDPIALAGAGASASNFDLNTVAPYVCTGTMSVPTVNGATIHVKSGFPIANLYNHLNSRFDLSNGQCDASAAPPDTNIKQYTPAAITWMTTKPIGYQTAESHTDTVAKRLETIADLPPPNSQTPTHYGPLWVFARAVPWNSYTGQPEPASGYTPFSATQTYWTSLYKTGPTLGSYPSPTGTATPYASPVQSPTIHPPGVRNRRVINVPLLDCPVSGSEAKVLGIGRFFMTIPADSASISAEFAGTVADQPIAGPVELYQ